MTTSLYDPLDDLYFDKADLKKELDQTFNVPTVDFALNIVIASNHYFKW